MRLNRGSMSRFETPLSRLWQEDLQRQQARTNIRTRQLCFISPRLGLGATLSPVRLSSIASVRSFHLCL
jgi:hypothetical protein